jgi:hypothetical protein
MGVIFHLCSNGMHNTKAVLCASAKNRSFFKKTHQWIEPANG